MDYWTLVNHSGYGRADNNQFKYGVENTHCSKDAAIKIRKAGGLLFGDYGSSYRAAEQANYPPEVKGLIPKCRGTFDRLKVDGLKVYLPASSESFDGTLQGTQLLDLG